MEEPFVEVRQALEACGPRRRGRYISAAVRARAIECARQLVTAGERISSVASKLNVSIPTVSRWLAPGGFVPVEVVAEPGRSSPLVLSTPSGMRVEGLSLEQVGELIRRLG